MTVKPVRVLRSVGEHGTLAFATDSNCPCDLCSIAIMGGAYNLNRPGNALTKAEHDLRMVNRDRPLTQASIERHRSSGNGHQLGELL